MWAETLPNELRRWRSDVPEGASARCALASDLIDANAFDHLGKPRPAPCHTSGPLWVMRIVDESSVVWSSDDVFNVGETAYFLVEFQQPLRALHASRSAPNGFAIYKTRDQIDAFVRLVAHFRSSRIVELGIWEGGSTALLAQLAQPDKLVAVDITPEPVPGLERFVASHALHGRVRPHYGIDQADGRRLGDIVASEFSGDPIDLVIDDASHLLAPTRASFDVLFPKLRTGGLFVIEDWCWEHTIADRLVASLRSKYRMSEVPRAELLRVVEAMGASDDMLASLRSREFLSDLVSEIVVDKANGDTTIGDVALRPFTVEVRRGPAAVVGDPPFVTSPHGRAERALHVGRPDPELVSRIARLGVRELVVVSDEPPSLLAYPGPEAIDVRLSPSRRAAHDIVGALGRAQFDLVIDGASADAEGARDLAPVLLSGVRTGGTYMLRGWPRLVMPPPEDVTDAAWRRMPRLLLELMLIVAEWNDTIDALVLDDEWLSVRRGQRPLPTKDFDLTHLYRDHFESLARA
jgi:predicted O-methyltransferase YrrM